MRCEPNWIDPDTGLTCHNTGLATVCWSYCGVTGAARSGNGGSYIRKDRRLRCVPCCGARVLLGLCQLSYRHHATLVLTCPQYVIVSRGRMVRRGAPADYPQKCGRLRRHALCVRILRATMTPARFGGAVAAQSCPIPNPHPGGPTHLRASGMLSQSGGAIIWPNFIKAVNGSGITRKRDCARTCARRCARSSTGARCSAISPRPRPTHKLHPQTRARPKARVPGNSRRTAAVGLRADLWEGASSLTAEPR
jgi:hypothetical protein